MENDNKGIVPFDERKMKDEIVRQITESRAFYKSRYDAVDDYIARYEAKRSISGLMGWGPDPKANPKNSPWLNSSDIGIPIEAFTIEGLLPRFLKVCYGAKPICWIRGVSQDDHQQAPIVQDALNYQLTKNIKIYRRMKNCFKNVIMTGDGIVKCVWEEEYKIINKVVYYVVDMMTGQPVVDEMGNPVTVSKDTEVQPPQMVVKKIESQKKKVYDGPKLYSRNIKQIVIPKNADTAEIDELDWICDQYELSLDEIKSRVGDPEEGDFDAKVVAELESELVNRTVGPDRERPLALKALVSEWHGRWDVNEDGMEEEIVVFIAQKSYEGIMSDVKSNVQESKLLCWFISPYPKRPFFHYQIIPMDGCFYGKGVPEFLIGIRNLIDAIFNQAIDRGSLNNNPPVIVPNGHDPDENPYGPGAQWTSDNPAAYRVLELPKNEQLEFQKIEFLLSLVQKLFGVTDYSLGTESSIASNRTASGIMTIVGEGNIKFDDMIRALQDVNEDMYDFIVQLNADLLSDEFVYYISGAENPFRKVNKQAWVGNFDFESAGNSININRQIEQERAVGAYRTMLESIGRNPAFTIPVILAVTENYFRSLDLRNIPLPNAEQLQQQKIADMAQAIQVNEQKNLEVAMKGRGMNGTATVPQTG